jgi:lipopolysaccharide transport system permease protein
MEIESMAIQPDVLLRPAAGRERVVIEPSRGWAALKLREIWRYRELVYFLTWRDIKVRYKQTALGAAWAIIQPLVNMVIFTLIFGRVAHLPSDGVPYPIFTFAALLPWTYFAYVMQMSGNSLVMNTNMVSKVYFPRLALPISAGLAGLLDLAIGFVVLIGMMLFYHVHPGIQILLLPLFLLLAVATALGVGVWLSALNVEYRDVKYALPLLIQVWLYASPVAYSASLITGKLAIIYALNPMAGVIEGFRWCLLPSSPPPGVALLPSVAIALLLLIGGLFYFRRMEQTFADVI